MHSGLIPLRASVPLVLLAVAACGGRREPRVGSGTTSERGRGNLPSSMAPFVNATQIYHEMGLIAATSGGIPFVGTVGYLAGGTVDTTLAVIAISFPNRVLTFGREGDRYRATYDARVDLKQGTTVVRHVEAQEIVRVATFKETTRSDESVIFQQILSVPPGAYQLVLSVRDAGSVRLSTYESTIRVPRLGAGAVGTPIAVYEARPRERTDSLPALVASPRATAVFGRDTALSVYAEGYGGDGPEVRVAAVVRGERGAVLWRDTIALARRPGSGPPAGAPAGAPASAPALFSGTFRVPVARMGVGPSTLVLRRADLPTDSTRAAVFVSFGEELPVATFEEMLNYLRFYAGANPSRLRVLRDTTPEARASAWAAFLRETDPVPGTAAHEGLREYFGRIQVANLRYREEGGPGWQTDRGMVYVSLGDPDQLYDQQGGELQQRGRWQVWEYTRHQTRLVFIDQSGFGRWRLNPQSEGEFRSLVGRLQRRGQ